MCCGFHGERDDAVGRIGDALTDDAGVFDFEGARFDGRARRGIFAGESGTSAVSPNMVNQLALTSMSFGVAEHILD